MPQCALLLENMNLIAVAYIWIAHDFKQNLLKLLAKSITIKTGVETYAKSNFYFIIKNVVY